MIRQVDHINIATEKLDETRDFFVRALGFEQGARPDIPFPGYWLYAGGRPIVHLQLANGPVSGSGAGALNHAAFEIDDFEACAARLERLGIPYRKSERADLPARQIFVEDPNGVLIELNAKRK